MLNGLEKFREEIDFCDKQIAELLSRRFEAVDAIGEYKKANNLPVYNADREKAVSDKVALIAGEKFEDSVREVYDAIFKAARKRQE